MTTNTIGGYKIRTVCAGVADLCDCHARAQ